MRRQKDIKVKRLADMRGFITRHYSGVSKERRLFHAGRLQRLSARQDIPAKERCFFAAAAREIMGISWHDKP